MVVREDGSKWACQSCLKGHRVSGCNHTDRELTLVPKKGRPVTQCQHCRLERKKRSAHVKCDCGEPDKPHHSREKCIHVREAEERAKSGYHEEHNVKQEEDPAHLVAVAEEQGCCCHHGGRCSCSLVKRESHSKGTSPPHGPAVQKPRFESAKSDSSLTVFANGHHKPVHRKNHAAHENGMPYKMPMARSHTDQSVSHAARRSVDSLPLGIRPSLHLSSASMQHAPPSNTNRQLSTSEQHSPQSNGACCGASDSNLESVDFNTIGSMPVRQSMESAANDTIGFPAFDPMSGLADSSYDPWSSAPSAEFMPNNNPFGAWATSFDNSNLAQPALTAASSGTQSEIDEMPAMEDLYRLPMPNIQEDAGRFSESTVEDVNNINRRSLPPNFFGNVDFDMTNVANNWATSTATTHTSDEGKPKSVSGEQAYTFGDSWATSTTPPMSVMASKPTTMPYGRPQSQSVGTTNAPNDDLIMQLFPGIEVNNGSMNFGMVDNDRGSRSMRGLSSMTSVPVDGSLADDDVGFIAQSWGDGSLSIPQDDEFTSSYHDFPSGTGYNDWPYQ